MALSFWRGWDFSMVLFFLLTVYPPWKKIDFSSSFLSFFFFIESRIVMVTKQLASLLESICDTLSIEFVAVTFSGRTFHFFSFSFFKLQLWLGHANKASSQRWSRRAQLNLALVVWNSIRFSVSLRFMFYDELRSHREMKVNEFERMKMCS